MDWTTEQVGIWLIENGFDQYVDRFKDEEIDGFALINLNSASIDQLLSSNTNDNLIKRPKIGLITKFERKLENFKNQFNDIDALARISTLSNKQRDLLSEQPSSRSSTDLSFLNKSMTDNGENEFEQQNSQLSLTTEKSNESSGCLLSTGECSPNENSSFQQKKFPLVYTLPKFDEAFDEAAKSPSTSDFGARCRKKQQLVKTIRDDVVNNYGIDFYPTSREFDRMIVSVRNKYPELRKIFGDDMALLIFALKQQFSRDRLMSGSSSQILSKKRSSYSHPMSGRKLKISKVDSVHRRQYMVEENNQSEESLMQMNLQAESLQTIVNTTNYDYNHVAAKMDVTYAHRQRLVHEMKSIKEIITLYPALTIVDLLIREINRHADPFNGDIIQTVKNSCSKIIKFLDHHDKKNITEDEQPLFLLEHLIMKRFKHSKKLLLNYVPLDAYPMIQTQVSQNLKKYSIVIEYNELVNTNSQIEALALLIGSYEIFNIQYPAKIRSTLEVLNGFFFSKRSFSFSLAAKRFLNEHRLDNR